MATVAEKCGFDEKRLARIETWMQRYVDEKKFPGSSVLIARHGEIAYQACVGMRDVATNKPWQDDTIVRIYSMTKPLTSLALMMLYERGLVHLDMPLSDFVPEFSDLQVLRDGATQIDQTEPLRTQPTIHQLLTHTAGFTYSFNEGLVEETYAAKRLDFGPTGGTLAEKARKLAAVPLCFQPGTRWHYSVAIDLIGRIIEVVSGKSLDQFFADEIFAPLAMTDTSFALPDNKLDRFASVYQRAPKGGLEQLDHNETSMFREGTVSCFSGGGGLLSTVHDYHRYADMMRRGGEIKGERLMSPRTLAFMRQNHLPGDIASMGPKTFAETPVEGLGFGLGFAIMLDPAKARMSGSIGDYGWGGMASTIHFVDPVEDMIVIFLTQLIPSSTYANRRELRALVHQALIN